MKTSLIPSLCGLLLFAGAPTYADVMLSDFDTGGPYNGGVQGWFGYGDAAALGTIVNPTGGNSTWMVKSPSQYWGQSTLQSWANPALKVANINANTDLQLDLILPGSGPNAWLPSNTSQSLALEIQVGGGALGTQTQDANITFNGALKDQVIHLDFNYYNAFGAFDPTATFVNLSLNLYPGYDWGWDPNNSSSIAYGAQVYLDNVQLTTVPEPGLFALAGLGALSLAWARRRG